VEIDSLFATVHGVCGGHFLLEEAKFSLQRQHFFWGGRDHLGQAEFFGRRVVFSLVGGEIYVEEINPFLGNSSWVLEGCLSIHFKPIFISIFPANRATSCKCIPSQINNKEDQICELFVVVTFGLDC